MYTVKLVPIKAKTASIRDAVKITHSQYSAGTSSNNATATGTRLYVNRQRGALVSAIATWKANWIWKEVYFLWLVLFRARQFLFFRPQCPKATWQISFQEKFEILKGFRVIRGIVQFSDFSLPLRGNWYGGVSNSCPVFTIFLLIFQLVPRYTLASFMRV